VGDNADEINTTNKKEERRIGYLFNFEIIQHIKV
jgi:hypothetical protein